MRTGSVMVWVPRMPSEMVMDERSCAGMWNWKKEGEGDWGWKVVGSQEGGDGGGGGIVVEWVFVVEVRDFGAWAAVVVSQV